MMQRQETARRQRRTTGKRQPPALPPPSPAPRWDDDNVVRLFDVLPTVDRLYDGSAARALEPVRMPPPRREIEIEPEPLPAPAVAKALSQVPARRQQHFTLLTGVLIGGLMVTALQFIRIDVDKPDAWVSITVVKPEPETPVAAPKPAAGSVEAMVLGCVQGATRGALTTALPAAELATTGTLSSVSAVVVATATGLGCVIGAAGDTAKDVAHWTMTHAPTFVQRWFGWQPV